MHWYNGGIADAITVTKQKGAIFVVYIEGSDDKSMQITNIINNEAITNKLESENFVAIKIEANSVPHQQFSEIYKQAPSPSIFFIGKSGVPLEIITEVKDLESLSLQIDNILQRAELSPITNTIPSESLIKAEQQSNNVVCENGVCSIRPSTQTMENSTASSSLSAEEKLNRAKELVEKQRIQKQKEEEEKERQKEIERRKMGQNVQQMKRWQEDQELKQLKEEREREKRENQAARDRVLAQIAQDKAERAAKFSTSPPTQPKVATPQAGTSRQQSNVARLQFKLPDGGSNTQEFPSSDSLDQVVTYIKTKLNITKFKLATTFPRREFTTNDYSQSLLDLQLVPNAVILVLPVNSGAVVASSAATSGLYAFFWSLIGPILSIFQYLKGYLTGAGGENDSTSGRSSGGTSSSRGSPPSARKSGNTGAVKRHGNIYRLSDTKDSDDENSTWNGNSTQQM